MTSPSNHHPTLSVIVISFNPPEILSRCLSAVMPQIEAEQGELLVVGRWAKAATVAALQGQFPKVLFIEAPLQETIPVMRLRGIGAAAGRLLALLEDDCIVGDRWCQTIIKAHEESSEPAVGGAVEPDDYPTLLDWAVYFCEYARFMGPFNGTVAALPGNNVSYKRDKLPPNDSMPDGFYEVFLHWQWQQDGRTLVAQPDMAVKNIHRWKRENVTRIPYQHGRSFAALRLEGQPFWKRILRALTAPFLPILQVGRIIKEVALRGRYLSKLFLALPWILLFYFSWMLGELAGYLAGSGTSTNGWQ